MSPQAQTGSWAFSILPFIEQQNIYLNQAWIDPVATYVCPSRRPAQAQTVQDDSLGYYQGGGWGWGHIDYAGNSRLFPDRPACRSLSWITDGTSNTIMVGEKCMDVDLYLTGSWFWDEPFFLGGSGGTARWGVAVLVDAPGIALASRGNWGSAHRDGAQFLFADGSTRLIAFGMSANVMTPLLTPRGGEVMPDF